MTSALRCRRENHSIRLDVQVQSLAPFSWRLGVVASVVRRMNEVTVHWARLVLGWVTVFGRPGSIFSTISTNTTLAITRRRSVAERGGCFQRRLFVCQHNSCRMIKHRMMKRGG